MTDNTKMRESFEKWAVSKGMPITRGNYYDVYASAETRAAYLAWHSAQSVPVVGEAVAYWFPTTLGTMEQVDDPKDAYVEFDAYAKLAATSITHAELDAKDARIRELEAANASLEASYRGSCMMYDATKVELERLRKDAERWRVVKQYGYAMEEAIDAAIAGEKK